MIGLMANDVLAHVQIEKGLERMSLPIVFILLLTCRLIIYYQERARERQLLEEKLAKGDKSDIAQGETEQMKEQTAEQMAVSSEEKKTQ